MLRATDDVPNISFSSFCWLDKSIDVCNTLRAFLLVKRAYTITAPAPTRNIIFVVAGMPSDSIVMFTSPPLETSVWKDSRPASVTPMKFTRSLPANAMASENVPMSTTTLRTFTLQKCNNCISIVSTTKEHRMNMPVSSNTNS